MAGEIGQEINGNDTVPVIDGRENDLMQGKDPKEGYTGI
jgi:hypothetical protein